jgi:Glycosyltransferase family 87
MPISNPVLRRKAVLCLLLSSFLSIVWGYWTEFSKTDGGRLGDFRAIYYGARTVINHRDPYKEGEFLQVYMREGGRYPSAPERLHAFLRAVPVCVNLPSTLFVVTPLALLGWTSAHYIWMILMPGGLMLAAWLIWDLADARAHALTLFLLCFLMANCEVLLGLGNGSGLGVSLCIAGVWCFFKERYELAGILCFALGLNVKAQEVGLIWLFLLLSGGRYRRRALQISGVAFVLFALSVLWMSQVSPHWFEEWRSNIASTSMRGDLNDPGPTSFGNVKLGMIVSLQSVISFFWDDPHIYNPAAWLLAGIPILIWCVITVRARLNEEGRWLALASMAALSLLPIYHRQYDVKLLFLTVPACALLWAQKSPIRKLAAGITAAGIVLTSDIPVAILVLVNNSLHLPPDQLAGQLVSVLLARTPTLALVLVGGFYLWAYARHASIAKARAAAPVEADPKLEMAALSA